MKENKNKEERNWIENKVKLYFYIREEISVIAIQIKKVKRE